MANQKSRKTGGGKLSRTQTVTVRLDPKLRYLAELAARKQRRTLSSFIEWAIEENLAQVLLREGSGYNGDDSISVAEEALSLWDVDESDRFAKLALHYPDMLTHDEQILWKLICENGYLWQGRYGINELWEWDINEQALIFKRLREHWQDFVSVAHGEANRSTLPVWKKETALLDPSDEIKNKFDEDIPF